MLCSILSQLFPRLDCIECTFPTLCPAFLTLPPATPPSLKLPTPPIMAELQVFDKDPNIYLFTSLTAGSSHIITATSRIETILKANKIPFIGLDTATHELGKKLFQRRAAGKKLPLLVKEGYVLGVRYEEAPENIKY